MTDFSDSWNLSRQRFVDEISQLNDEQLKWRPFGGALSIGQMALHVAGVETSFSRQLTGGDLSDLEAKLKSAATDGVVNDKPCPFVEGEITAAFVAQALAHSRTLVEPLMDEPGEEVLKKELKSALGPVITGKGALARLAFHSAYHQGQAYTYKIHPAFPEA